MGLGAHRVIWIIGDVLCVSVADLKTIPPESPSIMEVDLTVYWEPVIVDHVHYDASPTWDVVESVGDPGVTIAGQV